MATDYTVICDSCEKPIEDMSNRVQILIFTTEPIADPQLDLCGKCGENLRKDTKVVRAKEKAMKKIAAWMPAAEPVDATDEPDLDYEPQVGVSNAPVASSPPES
ncbi:MAG TPA: hypothetical protein VFI41_04555 [Gemmatimonadales bacterium]|nr:hypothetical protein [Gemmatimonadales bacterium]